MMNRNLFPIFGLLFIILFLSGCSNKKANFGFKNREECDSEFASFDKIVAKMKCYHQAAITSAGLGQADAAKTTCTDIWYKLGTEIRRARNIQAGNTDDQLDRADLEANNCFTDVAKILKDEKICDSITKRENSVVDDFAGWKVTRDICYQDVKNLKKFDIGTYKPGLCPASFILLLIPFVLFLRKK